MDSRELRSAAELRARLEAGDHDGDRLRAALLEVPPADRDPWLDAVLGLDAIPDDGRDLPRDGVPYLPCPVDALLRVVDEAPVRASDVFVDLGSGVGRAAALVHLLTGARAVGLEIQARLVAAARELATRICAPDLVSVLGDAAQPTRHAADGTVYFLYCPFNGDRLARALAELEIIARARPITVCCVDLPRLPPPWLELQPGRALDVAIYRRVGGGSTTTGRGSVIEQT